MGTIVQIFTAATRGVPMEMRRSVTALTDEGIVGDRYVCRPTVGALTRASGTDCRGR
jgi:hypothetical protein